MVCCIDFSKEFFATKYNLNTSDGHKNVTQLPILDKVKKILFIIELWELLLLTLSGGVLF